MTVCGLVLFLDHARLKVLKLPKSDIKYSHVRSTDRDHHPLPRAAVIDESDKKEVQKGYISYASL